MEIICYSCGRGENPENTLEGIRHCQNVNPDWRIEMDVHMSADQQLILFHDYQTLRVTGQDHIINEMNYKDIRGLNAGYHYNKDGSYPFRSKSLKIPKLVEVFHEFPKAKLLLDVHTNDPKVVRVLIDSIELEFQQGDFIIVSEYDDIIKRLKKAKPNWSYGVPEKEAKKMLYSSFVFLDGFFPIKSDILMLPKKYWKTNVLTKRVIHHAKKRNKKIWAWLYEGECVKTVNSKKEMEVLLSLGVDGVFTGHPEKLFNELKEVKN